jgi:hypothetical protein
MDNKSSRECPDAAAWNDGVDLLLSALPISAYCRTAAAHARVLQAMTTSPRVKQYLGEMIARYEGRVGDFERPSEA